MPRKCILLLLDGIGDRSYEELGDRTPLQAADTPVMDSLAEKGANGLYHAGSLGQALPSENAHFAMFGYDLRHFPGRGALEALGAGIPIEPTDVAVLAHFVSLREEKGCLQLIETKPELSSEEAADLSRAVASYHMPNASIRFHPVGGIRGIVTLQGNVSRFVTDSDPFLNGRLLANVLPWETHRDDPASGRTAAALRMYLLWAFETLSGHPVNRKRIAEGCDPINGIVTQRAGSLQAVVPFSEKYGLRGLSMASGLIYWGLGKYVGMDVRQVEDADDPGYDLAERIRSAHELLSRYDFIHVHTKAPDEAAHRKDPLLKKKVIESIDKGIGSVHQLLLSDPELLLVVTADHSTPSAGPLIHSGESVPLLFYGEGVRRDSVKHYNEVSASAGAMGNVRGREFMYLILNHLERAKLQGIMDTPVDQPYWPGRYEPLKIQK